jgi:hypothetical protein
MGIHCLGGIDDVRKKVGKRTWFESAVTNPYAFHGLLGLALIAVIVLLETLTLGSPGSSRFFDAAKDDAALRHPAGARPTAVDCS